jgi:two-component system, LytTR family, sensor kinase
MIEKIARFPIPKNTKTILWHIGLWALVVGIPLIFDSSGGTSVEMREQIREQLQAELQIGGISNLNTVFYGVLVVFFYINYSFLIPKIFYPKGLKWYIGALVIDYGFFTLIMYCIIHFFAIKFAPPIYVFVLPFTLINAISLAIRVTATRMEEERNKQSRENETLKSELSFLRSQISPHFLFNIMNSIVAMSRVKPELVEPTLIQLSQLMRYMLYESDENKVPIDREIEYLESYIALQKMRFGKSLNIEIEKQILDKNAVYTEGSSNVGFGISDVGKVPKSDVPNPKYTEGSLFSIEPMLLIPFVENAFKHGVGMIREPMIKIQIFMQDNQLIFNVLNKFNKDTEEQKDFDSGIGLKNVSRRLELVYGKEHSLKTVAENDLFVVNLKINLKK